MTHSPLPVLVEEPCPSCGEWAILVEDTGWCANCTQAANPEIKICPCGAVFKANAQHDKCWACRKEDWLNENADRIESYLASGVSLTAALKQVADDNRPDCMKCGEPIRGGRNDARFHRNKPECRRAYWSYISLRRSGLSPEVALTIIIGGAAEFDSR